MSPKAKQSGRGGAAARGGSAIGPRPGGGRGRGAPANNGANATPMTGKRRSPSSDPRRPAPQSKWAEDGPATMATMANSASKRGPVTRRSMFPANAQLLLGALAHPRDNARLLIDGKELAEVTIVGEIKKVEDDEKTGTITVHLQDETGVIPAKLLNDADLFPDGLAHVQEGTLVRVVGALKGQPKEGGSGLFINCFAIRVVEHNAEREFHRLDILYAQKLRYEGGMGMFAGADEKGGQDLAGAESGTDEQKAGDGEDTKMADKCAALDELKEKVAKVMELSRDSDTGISWTQICEQLPDEDATKLRAAIDDMKAEGLCYNTHDDNHFKLM